MVALPPYSVAGPPRSMTTSLALASAVDPNVDAVEIGRHLADNGHVVEYGFLVNWRVVAAQRWDLVDG